MAEIIHLSERHTIPPKSVTAVHMHQRYTCTFDPNAPPHEQWLWQVNFTRTFHYYGAAPSLPVAEKQARKRIQQLLTFQEQQEESE